LHAIFFSLICFASFYLFISFCLLFMIIFFLSSLYCCHAIIRSSAHCEAVVWWC
jgi:hypothetical protein